MKRAYRILFISLLIAVALLTAASCYAQSGRPKPKPDDRRNENRERQPAQNPGGGSQKPAIFHTDVPEHPFDIILGRPTNNSVTFSILAYQDIEGYVEYGIQPNQYSEQTAVVEFTKGEPLEMLLEGLQANTRYYYRFRPRKPRTSEFEAGRQYFFHTQRAPGSTFTFAVQADPHLDQNTAPEVYTRTLLNARDGNPDFYVDLGDTFMTDKYRDNYKDSFKQYLAQRYYFGLIGTSSPVFLVLGNHDGEAGQRLNGQADNMTIWANTMRKTYFPNPFPDGFYTGNSTEEMYVGLPENYYTWEWGDALFVVLDPYWPTTGKGNEPWNRTLGEQQYQWLKQTLEQSEATFKFVFIHYLLGGKDNTSRGGIAIAKNFEWGGHNTEGVFEFPRKRPGWETPIHQLLVKYKVSAVFHGHDHMFAKEELDGVVYQLVPQPGHPGSDGKPRSADEYGYVHGDVLSSSGYLRLTVSPENTLVEYVRTYLPKDEQKDRKNGDVVYSYTILP